MQGAAEVGSNGPLKALHLAICGAVEGGGVDATGCKTGAES